MANQENSPFPGSHAGTPPRVPTLVEVTNQLTSPDDQLGPVQLPPAPQVVFVSSEPCSLGDKGDEQAVIESCSGVDPVSILDSIDVLLKGSEAGVELSDEESFAEQAFVGNSFAEQAFEVQTFAVQSFAEQTSSFELVEKTETEIGETIAEGQPEASAIFAAGDQSVVEQRVTEESVTEESVIEESVIEESVIEESVIEESVIEDSVIEDSVIEGLPSSQLESFEVFAEANDDLTGAWRHRWFYSDEPRFLLDPFDQAIDGPIPVLPSLPVLKAIEMTESVVSRERPGMHYAWRLLPGPYPDLGNTPQLGSAQSAESTQEPISQEPISTASSKAVAEPEPESDAAFALEVGATEVGATEVAEALKATEVAGVLAETEAAEAFESDQQDAGESGEASVDEKTNDLDDASLTPSLEGWSPQQLWTESEVVADENTKDGDDFYAQPGDVISIDGNQGYDHIDLSSYPLEDATFQPGAILLNSNVVNEQGEPEPPVIIRYRGIGFAIFAGDVRVEL